MTGKLEIYRHKYKSVIVVIVVVFCFVMTIINNNASFIKLRDVLLYLQEAWLYFFKQHYVSRHIKRHSFIVSKSFVPLHEY